ncbi:DUF6912 family protein [Dietzia psychralcaliphila]|uniref:Uncharacterized protein n=1 Tax=Dietzia psychralcaliphila TaxID=139021 RepID=A0AAD0JSB3_9ACTN|nr:hypothetical protein [Dietzia psychralcaliphila]AWH94905.1 hypothetical protein A6048_04705 [Dietzia psychralcaliphila]PTM86778.1 hypothetical protein C8N39_106107 [Dietzia psychralcaliphila]
MRLFIPATLAMLETLLDGGEMPVRSATAFAATPALVESYAQGDTEEIEHVAFLEAARASLRLLGGEIDAGAAHDAHPYRRVVVSVDVPDADAEPRPDLDTAVVRLTRGTVTMAEVAAVHVDLAGAAGPVEAAVEAVDRADLGDEDAELTVGDALDLDLAWYDAAELPFLLNLL